MGVKGKRNIKRKEKLNFTHRELCFDLAIAKGTRFIEVPLGSVWLNSFDGPGQADVITIKPSYNRFNLDIYEIKVSRSDLLNDIKSGKYKKYLPHCNRLYFAVKQDICNKEEIPEGVGLIVRGDRGWKTVKSTEKREIEPSIEMLQALVFFNGRVFNKKRIELSKMNTVLRKVDKTRLKGIGKEIKQTILKYNDLELKFRNLLYVASDKIKFKTQKEKEDFEDYWENKTYIY